MSDEKKTDKTKFVTREEMSIFADPIGHLLDGVVADFWDIPKKIENASKGETGNVEKGVTGNASDASEPQKRVTQSTENNSRVRIEHVFKRGKRASNASSSTEKKGKAAGNTEQTED